MALARLMRFKPANTAITAFIGFVPIALFSGIWALVSPLNSVFFCALSLLQIILLTLHRYAFLSFLRRAVYAFVSMKLILRFWFTGATILLLYAASGGGLLPDNETYYIQTVKWLNEAGYVSGLANLHIFLAQQSGWHLIQAAFSFPFLEIDFNDLSAFALWLLCAFSVRRLDVFYKTGSRIELTAGLFTAFLPMLLFFAAVPSPDLAVIAIAALMLWLFLADGAASGSALSQLLLLGALACFVKVTAGLLLVLPLYLAYKNGRMPGWQSVSWAGALFVLFLLKNSVVSGYPLYPLTAFRLDAAHSVPQTIGAYFFGANAHLVYGLSPHAFNEASVLDLLKIWLSQPSPDSWLNFHALLAALVFLFFSLKHSKWRVCAILFAIHMVLLLLSGPHFRFALHWSLFASAAIATLWFMRFPRTIPAVMLLSLFTAFGLQSYIDKQPDERRIELGERLVLPHDNSRLRPQVQRSQRGNLHYNAPVGYDLFWITSDVRLPAVSNDQLDYFEKYFGVYPQRDQNGFKSARVPKVSSEAELP